MIKSPANDLSMLTKPQTYKDIATGFGSAAESMVRGAGAAPFGLPGDIIRHFQETPLIPGVTDNLSLGNVFPGYDTVKEAVAPTPFALPQRRVPNASYAPEQHKQELFGLPYATTGDILDIAEKRYTPQFGDKEANDFMESLGMFLSPQMAAGARTGIINMVETTGKMPSLGRESAQAFARDYTNAMNGVYPEAPTAGSMAADFARTGKKVASGIEDVTVGNYQRGQVRRAAQGAPDDTAYDPLRQRREAQAAAAYSVPEGANPMYAVRRANQGQMLKETDLPNLKYVESNPKIHTVGYKFEEDALPYTGEEYPNTIRQEYYQRVFDKDNDINKLYQDWASNKYMEMFPDAPNLDAARRRYSNQGNLIDRSKDQLRLMSEFAQSPEANTFLDQKASARDIAVNEYNEVKNKPKSELTEGLTTEEAREAKEAHQAKVDELELELLKNDFAPELTSEQYRKRIEIPTAEEYLRRANAARKYIMGEFRNDIAKYTGTSQGPQMELAKKGITFAPKEELLNKTKEITRGGQDFRDLQKRREEAGFNPLGEMQPLIVDQENILVKLQENLNEMNTKRYELTQQHRIEMPEEPDPARNTGPTGAQYRALKNPMNSLIEKIEKTKKLIENFQLANAYETLSDLSFVPGTAEHWRKVIPYDQRDFFPNLFPPPGSKEVSKTPDEADIFNISTGRLKQMGTDFLAEQYANAIIDGRIPIDEKGKPTISVEKFIEQITRPRIKEDELKNLEGSRAMMRVNDYALKTLDNIPRELKFENASVLELTKDNPMPVIRRQVSFDGMVLDNCVAGCSAPHPGINPFTNESYSYAYPVDVATGTNRGDRELSSSFMEAIHDGSQRYASIRDNKTGIPVVNINMRRTGDANLPDNQRKFNLEYVSGYQNNQIDKKYTNDVRDYLNARADIIQGSGTGLNKWGIFDLKSPEGQSAAARALGAQPSDLGAFDLPRFVTEKDLTDIANQQPQSTQLTTQVRTAPNDMARPSLFRRMSTEALRNAVYLENQGDPVERFMESVLDDPSLTEIWSDDYQLYPGSLMAFADAIRDGNSVRRAVERASLSEHGIPVAEQERLARVDIELQDFTPMQREFLGRELDDYAETQIRSQIETLNPDDPDDAIHQYLEDFPGADEFLRDIEMRRSGRAVMPQQAQTAMPVPRDIAEQVVSRNLANRDEVVQQLTERLNNSVRSLPEDRETLMEAWQQYQRQPSDIPGGILMVLPVEGRDQSVRTISNYLVQQIQNRLNFIPPLAANDAALTSLANDIVVPNSAFRDQTVADTADAIRSQLLPSIERFSPRIPGDREHLEREVQFYQNSPLDRDLGQRLESYIQAHPNRENQIRERIADFMIEQIQTRLGNRAPAPQGAPTRSTAVMNAASDITQTLYTEARDNNFEMRDLTSTLHALDAGNFDHPMIRALPETDRAAVQQDIAASMRLLLQNQNIDIPYNIFADGIPGAAPEFDQTITSYRDRHTNELTGSRRAFDEVMQAERMTPGAINEAILRTDGDARYNQETMDFYRVDSPAGVQQLNHALRAYMEGNGFDVPPRPPENPIAELERRYPAREDEYVYDPDDMMTEIDYEMERQERRLTRNQYSRLDDLVDEIQRDAGENFEDLIDAIDRIRMRQGVDGDVDLALGDIRARLIRTEEASRLEFDRQQRNAEQERAQRPVVVPPEAALQGALDGATHIYGPEMGREIQDLVDNLQNDDVRFDREPNAFIARLRDESNEYDGHNQGYSDAVGEMADFLENYMRERAANRPQGRKRGGYIKKKMMNGGGKVEPVSPSSTVNDQSKPVVPVKKIQNPDAPEFKDIYNRERAIRGGGGGSGSPADLKQMMNPRNITYNAGGNVSVDQMRYELLRK
jgi:hypothetical protein